VIKRTMLTIGAVLAATGVAACGSTGTTTTQTSATAQGGTATNTAATTRSGSATAELAPSLKPPTALVVNKPLSRRPPVEKAVFLSNGIEIAQQIGQGMQAASQALGWRYSTLTVDQNNPATVASNMLSAINSGANVVFVSATPVAVFARVLPIARQHHTVIIDVASGNPPTNGITALVNNASQNGPVWGKMLALGALADAERRNVTAKILLVTSPVFATILGPTDTAAKSTVAQTCPNCSFATLDIPAGDLFSGKAPTDVVSYLQSHQSVNYILQDSSLTDQGLTAALKPLGLTSLRIFGVAPLQPQVDEVTSGQEAGWVVDPLQVEGWMAVDAAARSFTHDDPTLYNAQGIPSYLLTKANSPGPTEVPTDYQNQFKTIWHAQ